MGHDDIDRGIWELERVILDWAKACSARRYHDVMGSDAAHAAIELRRILSELHDIARDLPGIMAAEEDDPEEIARYQRQAEARLAELRAADKG